MKDLTVGIDIGGTNTKYGIVDREGNVLHQGNIATMEYEEFQDYFDAMADALRKGIAELPHSTRVVGIGVGAANGNYYSGNIERATNLKWKGVLPLARMFNPSEVFATNPIRSGVVLMSVARFCFVWLHDAITDG